MKPWDKIKMWLFGSEADARLLHERHMPAVSIGLPTDETGDQQDDVDGTLVGGVIWPVKQGTHGGRAFLSSAVFLAEYDKKKREVWMLDRETGTRHTGALPLKVGDTVFPLSDSGGRGVVIRTAEFGNAGIKRNVFIPLAGLMAHHLPPDQPTESSQVHDKDGRAGGLHYLTRVREFVREFCLGATAVVGERLFAPLLNFTRNGDNTPAHGAAHFRVGEACLSAEAGGPLHPADDGQHELGQTSEAKVMSAGLEIEQTKFGSTPLGIIYSPAEFIRDPWVPGAKGPIVKRVEWREDFNDQHVNACGKTARGRKKWLTWADKRTYPVYPPPKAPPRRPPGVPPTIPPEIPPQPPLPPFDDSPPPPIPGPITGDPPPPSTDDPGSPIKPVTGERPTNSGPNEEEQPSIRGVAVPDLDKPQSRGENDGTERGWRDTLGFNEAEWLRFPRISHDVAQGVFLQEYAAGTLAADALFALYAHGTFARDLDGNWYGARGHGQGVQTLMPGGLEGYLAYKARNGGDLPAGYTPTLTRLLLNYKTAASREVRTYFGMGARAPKSVLPASGFYIALDYTDSTDTPHIDIRTTDANGLADSGAGGQELRFNGSPIGGSGASDFTDLTDVPASYSGAASKVVTVKSAEDGLEFSSSLTGLGSIGFATLQPTEASPSQITSNQTAYILPTATLIRLSTDESRDIVSMAVPSSSISTMVLITNVGGFDIVFKNQDTSDATASQRIITGLGGDYTLGPDQSVWAWYDKTTLRWRLK